LQLVNAENLQVAFAREQVRQAFVRVDTASVLWLPSIRGGVNYDRHEGAIQAVDGTQFNTSRGAFYTGAGAGVYGAGTPIVPGVYANFHLADAIFQPLAARQFADSRSRAAAATTNDTLLQVSLAYIELQRAAADVNIANESLKLSGELADITSAYAQTGAGLAADANRMRAELAVRQNDAARSDEVVQVSSARLAQLLRLDPTVGLVPVEEFIVPIDMTACEIPVRELVALGLAQRPELAESRLLVAEAQQRLRREQFAPLIPSVLLGASYGGMSAGVNQAFAPFSPRLDADALAYWEMRNLGFGEVNARRGAQSVISQAQMRQLSTMDLVAREVVEAHIQVQSRRGRIATASRGVQAAAASHQQNLARIRDAKGLPIEVLQSVQALAQARREHLRAIVDYNTAQFTLHRALGWHGASAKT
jgi:outer membrane protein TolC